VCLCVFVDVDELHLMGGRSSESIAVAPLSIAQAVLLAECDLWLVRWCVAVTLSAVHHVPAASAVVTCVYDGAFHEFLPSRVELSTSSRAVARTSASAAREGRLAVVAVPKSERYGLTAERELKS
jgi:hypothetical protein